MKTDREKAMEWWNSFNSKLKQVNLIIKHLPNRPKSLKLDNITGREIEIIWRQETQQKPNINLSDKPFIFEGDCTVIIGKPITVKRPILYTEEEVFNLCYSAMKERDYTPLCVFQEWFNQNKKK